MTAKNIAYTGVDASISFDLSEALDSSVNLVGKTMLSTIKLDRLADDGTAIFKHDKVIDSDDLDPDNTKSLIIPITAEEMQAFLEKKYFFDLKIFDTDGVALIYIPYQELDVTEAVTERITISS